MESPPATLTLDAGNTRVAFSVRWFGVINVSGSFASVAGTVEVPGTDHQEASISGEVESLSVHTGIALRDRHLRGLRFLDSARHPVIRFVSTRVSRHNGVWDVKGRLTLRGLDRDVSLSVREDAASKTHRRLMAEFEVPRHPHAIGTAAGLRRLNPLLWAIGGDVTVSIEVLVPVTMLAAEHAPAR
jgi:polyisoprenoid-binding protein YceI